MNTIKVDTHTHTLASTHAYCTVLEMARAAAEAGLEGIAITDHGSDMKDAPHPWHFKNLKNIPRNLFGVKILYGIELNIRDLNGRIDDIDTGILKKLDVVNASIHGGIYDDEDASDHTSAYMNIVKNPLVDIICHSGTARYPYDYEAVIKEAKIQKKLIEINNHSFYARKSSIPNCKKIAALCKQYEVGIVVSSDAHFITELGEYTNSFELLSEIDFPEKLIMNRSLKAFEDFMADKGKPLYRWNMEI